MTAVGVLPDTLGQWHSFHEPRHVIGYLPPLTWEPVSGIEPLTCRLQEARFVAICALTALIAQLIALMAPVELEFSGSSSHDSSHAAEQQLSRTCNAA